MLPQSSSSEGDKTMRNIPFILFAALCLCLCACAAPAAAPTAEPVPEAVSINLYHADENFDDLVYDLVTIPELSPDCIMTALHEQGVLSEPVAVNSFLMDKTGVIRLDLAENFGNIMNSTGTSGEYIMMGSLVNTFLDAYHASGLMLQVDGKTLETGHSIYDWTLEYFPLEP